MVLTILLYLLLWILCGLIPCLILTILDMRGKEFEPDYFDKDIKVAVLIMLAFGPVSMVCVLCKLLEDYFFDKVKNHLVYLIWKLANIGLKKDESPENKEDEQTE